MLPLPTTTQIHFLVPADPLPCHAPQLSTVTDWNPHAALILLPARGVAAVKGWGWPCSSAEAEHHLVHTWAQVPIPKDTETQWGHGLGPSSPFSRLHKDCTEKAIFPPSILHFLGTFGPSVGAVTAQLCSAPSAECLLASIGYGAMSGAQLAQFGGLGCGCCHQHVGVPGRVLQGPSCTQLCSLGRH